MLDSDEKDPELKKHSSLTNGKSIFSSLYSKLTGQIDKKEEEKKEEKKEEKVEMKKSQSETQKISPFKKAGNFIKKRIDRLSHDFSGDSDKKIAKDGDEIFEEKDLTDQYKVTADRYHLQQINDKFGKGLIEEKIIAQVTGAKQVLKVRNNRGPRRGEEDIFEIIQLFGNRNDPLQNLLMNVAMREDQFGMDSDEDLEVAFRMDFGGARRDNSNQRNRNRGMEVLLNFGGDRPRRALIT